METKKHLNNAMIFVHVFAAHFQIPVKLMKINDVVYHCLACQPSFFFLTPQVRLSVEKMSRSRCSEKYTTPMERDNLSARR